MRPSSWRERPEAHDELLDAARWYEDKHPGLGGDLMDAVSAAIGFVLGWPDAAPLDHQALSGAVVRAKSVMGFPYRVVYVVDRGEVVVLAYTHLRRRPGYWTDRFDA